MAALGAEAVFFQAGSAAARTGMGAFGHSSPLQGRHVSFNLPYDRGLAICSTLELVELRELDGDVYWRGVRAGAGAGASDFC